MQQDLLDKIKVLHESNDFDGIIDLISTIDEELTLDIALELARAYINKANIDGDFALYQDASDILDRFGQATRDNPIFLFYKGYCLFKMNLIDDAIIRLERALRFIDIKDAALLTKVQNTLNSCKNLKERSEITFSDEENALISLHIKEKFGEASTFAIMDNIDLLKIESNDKHNYDVIMTKGLSAYDMNVPSGYAKDENAYCELCIILPKKWDYSKEWPLNLIRDFAMQIVMHKDFLGFGYTVDNYENLKDSRFSGAMLTALGDYAEDCQYVKINNKVVRFLQIIPLLPMEVAYRKNHSANDLLDIFKLRHIVLTPIDDARIDVCQSLEITN